MTFCSLKSTAIQDLFVSSLRLTDFLSMRGKLIGIARNVSENNSQLCSSARLSFIGTPGREWTRWSSLKLRVGVFFNAFCFSNANVGE